MSNKGGRTHILYTYLSFIYLRYKEARVALEAARGLVNSSALDNNKKNKFIKDVQANLQKVIDLVTGYPEIDFFRTRLSC